MKRRPRTPIVSVIAVAGMAMAGLAGGALVLGCRGGARDADTPAAARIDGVVLATVDTLRADRVGAYGWRAARTPAMDAIAARGVRAERAYASAPITLASHASLLTGLYPPRHGARHNGMRMRADVPTLAEQLRARGFATGAFVAAFPLDRRFGLDRGFEIYSDALPRAADGRPLNERPGRLVVDDALAWLAQSGVVTSSRGTNAADGAPASDGGQPRNRDAARTGRRPFFLWIHLFEPHAPYEADDGAAGGVAGSAAAAAGAAGAAGTAASPSGAAVHSPSDRSLSDRYDDEIARADAQIARLVEALAPRLGATLFVVTGDHGEAFGEHGEIGHSVFVYDTTLRVPLLLAGPGIRAGVMTDAVSLVDVAPTILDLLGPPSASTRDAASDVDGVSLRSLLAGGSPDSLGRRALYAESFAPLLDFGWSPLRTVREGADKYIAAPRAELYDVAGDPGETRNLLAERPDVAKALAGRVAKVSPADLPTATAPAALDPEALARLRSLGYLASSSGHTAPPAGATSGAAAQAASGAKATSTRRRASGGGGGGGGGGDGSTPEASASSARPDPKDRIGLAARIAEVTSGELRGPALREALTRIVREDPRNGQMQMRLGFLLLDAGDCRAAMPRFDAAIAAALPSADPHLGLAECLGALGRRDAARRALAAADRIEPGNPVVAANLGLMDLDEGRLPAAIERLRAALARAPDLHQARFALARAYGRAGQRADAAREARTLLDRLPPDAPQRAEVERLLAAVQ